MGRHCARTLSGWWVVVAAAAGCHADDKTHPIIPGGPVGPVGVPQADARVNDAATDSATLRGRVCLVGDLRDVSACASAGAGGLIVALGTRTATTAENGEFSMAAPAGSSLVWRVTGDAIRTTLAPYSAASTIPVIAAADYEQLASENGVLEVAAQGAIVAHVVAEGLPVNGATATTSPIAAYPALYDGAAARLWTQNATGDRGAIWIPGLPVGTATLAVSPAGKAAQLFAGIPVADAALTFVTVELSPSE